MRRLECKHLAFFAQGSLNFGEWRAAPCADDEFCRFVINDAAIGRDFEYIADRRTAVEVLATATANAQRRFVSSCGADGGGELLDDSLHKLSEAWQSGEFFMTGMHVHAS